MKWWLSEYNNVVKRRFLICELYIIFFQTVTRWCLRLLIKCNATYTHALIGRLIILELTFTDNLWGSIRTLECTWKIVQPGYAFTVLRLSPCLLTVHSSSSHFCAPSILHFWSHSIGNLFILTSWNEYRK